MQTPSRATSKRGIENANVSGRVGEKRSGWRQKPHHVRTLQTMVRTEDFTLGIGERHWRVRKANSMNYVLASLWLLHIMQPVPHFTDI